MPHKEIRDRMAELQRELKQSPKETGQLEALLEHAREEIERFTPEAVQDLLQTLKRDASELEREHPQITALINQIATMLSNLGI